VSELRFADASNGWAFGPDLYSTHDGGGHWQRETLPAPGAGYAAVSLEASGGVVFALAVPRSGQTGPAVLFRQPVAGGGWSAEPGATVPGGQRGRVVLQGAAGWLAVVTSQGATAFLSRQADGWQRRSLPCPMPTEALSASSTTDLVVVCGGAGAAGSQEKDVYVSHDAGSTFGLAGHAPLAGDLEDVAFGSPTTIVIAAASGASVLHGSFDGGRTWSTVAQEASGGLPWRDLGFTDPTHAEVILGTAASQFAGQPPSQLLMSSDGGHTWAALSI